jgi:hypothetical protein
LVLPLIALTAIGSAWVWEYMTHSGLKYVWRLGFVLVLLGNFAYFGNQYGIQHPVYHAWQRDVADERAAEWIAENTSTEKIYVTGKLGPQYPYLLWSGALTWDEYLPVASQRGEYHWQAGRFEFGDDSCLPLLGDPETLYLIDVRCELPAGYVSQKVIRFADNVAEFDIRQFIPTATLSAEVQK